ncbi:RNA-binding protein NOB1 [Liparis tanakae]|uniref:RNA-binding protein NOB1 n=1 Tax=Liparis tanakae TaxID=230148 RepID=A0A4Z2EFE9_9TELE|nr:RNA-binding protein NOB1 [Liparis tanakae]
MLIRQARSYILRCHACFRTTSIMTKAFCPHCGNATLKKLAVTLGEDGSTQVHFSRNPKVLNPRGLRRAPQQRLSRKARQQTDALDPDYAAGGSPFCQNDVYSRAANLQIRDGRGGGGRRRSNPNATHKKSSKKK